MNDRLDKIVQQLDKADTVDVGDDLLVLSIKIQIEIVRELRGLADLLAPR